MHQYLLHFNAHTHIYIYCMRTTVDCYVVYNHSFIHSIIHSLLVDKKGKKRKKEAPPLSTFLFFIEKLLSMHWWLLTSKCCLALYCTLYLCLCRWIWPWGRTFFWCPRSLSRRSRPHSPCLRHISSVLVCRSHLWHSGIPLHCTQSQTAALKQKSHTDYRFTDLQPMAKADLLFYIFNCYKYLSLP